MPNPISIAEEQATVSPIIDGDWQNDVPKGGRNEHQSQHSTGRLGRGKAAMCGRGRQNGKIKIDRPIGTHM